MNTLALGLLLLAGSLSGSDVRNDFEKGLLWKVSGNGLEKPSYIFGTLHLICTSDFYVFGGIDEKLAESDRLVLELDLTDPTLMIELQREMFMDNDTQLSDLIAKPDYELLETFFVDSFGMDMSFLSRFQPYFLITMLYPHMLGCIPKSYEQFFITQAMQREIEIMGLETLQEQLHVFDALSYNDQAEFLMEFLKNFDDKRKEFQQMLEMYLNQDLAGLWQIILNAQTDNEEFNRRLLYDRNHRWIASITALMREGPVFIAVGAGHLPGRYGILKMIEDEGFTVERVYN